MSSRIDIVACAQDFSVVFLQNTKADVQSFSSEYPTYTYFLQKIAPLYEEAKITRTYLIVRKSDSKIIAYFTIMPGSVTVGNKTRPAEVPEKVDELGTLHIHHLAADKYAVEQYRHIVKYIVLLLRNLIINHVSTYLNISYISLDADINENPDIEDIYENAGFKALGYKGELPSMICPVYSNI